MRILMLSLDKGLVGAAPLGDVMERHRNYGKFVEGLDIIVLCRRGYQVTKLSENVSAYPTNSWAKIFYFFDAIKIAKSLFGRGNYDLIVAQDPYMTGWIGKFLKQKYGAKLLVHFHGDYTPNLFSKNVVRVADGIRVMSKGQKENLAGMGVSEKSIRVISTPVDVERFANFKASLQRPEKKIVLMVGRPDPIKGYDVLEKARDLLMSKRNDLEFWLIGNKDATWADKTVANVAWQDLPQYYYSAYLVVLPSYSESFGKVLVEANACGRPVVATATTGAKEIVEDRFNGYLVPVGDHQALAEKIIYLLDHPDIAKQMGENGRKLVLEKYKDSAAKIVEFWQEI